MDTKTAPLASLKPHPKNVRVGDIQLIKDSLQHHGQYRPIVVQQSTNHILAGNHTYKAAKELGWETIEATFIDVDNDQALRILLMDNRANDKATYDTDELVGLLDQLLDTDLELTGTGFSMGDLDDLLADIDTPDKDLNDMNEIPEPPVVPVSKLGDVWLLGKHRLMCGDSTDLPTVERLMNGVKADMVFTDPPYNTGMSAKTNSGSTKLNHMFNDDYTDSEWSEFMRGFTQTLDACTKDNAALYVCFAWKRNHELMPHLINKFKLSNIIVWDKVVHGLGSDYQYTYEIINVCKKGKPKIDSHQGDDREYQDVWRIQRVMGRNDDHATAKPLELCARAIRHASKTNEIVLDIFGGSGSTLIAAEQTNRLAYVMELDPQYVDVICKRYQQATGTQPVLEATGTPHDFSVE